MPDTPASPAPAADTPVGLPPVPPAAPASPAPAATPPAAPPEPDAPPVVYDLTADPAGLGKLDLQGAKLAGKYDSVPAVLQALADAEARSAVPETYDFGETGKAFDPDAAASLTREFREMGFTQDQAAKALPKLVEIADALATAKGRELLADEWKLTGAEFDKRLGEVAEWAGKNLPPEVYQKFAAMGAHGVLAAESMMAAKWERPLFHPAAPASAGPKPTEELFYGHPS